MRGIYFHKPAELFSGISSMRAIPTSGMQREK